MVNVPGWLLRHRVVIAPYLGNTANGPKWGPEVTVRGFLDHQTREVRDRFGEAVVSSSTFRCRLDAVAPAESKVTLPDGRETRVIAALRRDGGGLPTPDHLELQLV